MAGPENLDANLKRREGPARKFISNTTVRQPLQASGSLRCPAAFHVLGISDPGLTEGPMARFRKANPRQMACDLGIPIADLRYKATGINRMAFYLNLEAPNTDGTQSVICGNVPNRGYIPHLPAGVAVEVPVLVDTNCLRPTVVNAIPPRFIARVRINLNGQELTVAALLEENPDHNYHAAMRNPHTAAERNLRQIRTLVDDLIAAHRDWLPASSRRTKAA